MMMNCDILEIDWKSKIGLNKKQRIDGIELMKKIPSNTIKTCFFDPQYRGLLDKMRYGDEGMGRFKERYALPQMDENKIIEFISGINRVLLSSGHLFLWIDKFHLCTGIGGWLKNTELEVVDMITWNKGRIGMGYRTRRKAEYCVIIQKKPIKSKGHWFLHNIPDIFEEKVERTHSHSKPVNLQKLLIETTTKEGDIVLDPAAGGFSVLESCILSKRNFIGGDIEYDGID